MGKDRVFLEDIIDVSPFVEEAEKQVERCRIAAFASEKRKYDSEAVHEWVVERAKARDSIVEFAMRALLERDCAWGAADLDHSPFERYMWELTAEICEEPLGNRGMWFATIGSFESCGQTFEVSMHRPSRSCSKVPHMHVRMVHIPPVPDVCVGIFEPIYVPSGIRHCSFDDRHREDFANYMWHLDSWADPWPIWFDIATLWDDICKEDDAEVPDHPTIGVEHEFPVPDYHMLHWPGDDGTRS